MDLKYCIFGCQASGLLFRFPDEYQRRQQWFKAVNMKYTTSAKFLCGKHFSSCNFTNKVLNKQAFPDKELRRVALSSNNASNTIADETNVQACADDKLNQATKIKPPEESVKLLTNKERMKDKVLTAAPKRAVLPFVPPKVPRESFVKTPANEKFKSPIATRELLLARKEFERDEKEFAKLPTNKNAPITKPSGRAVKKKRNAQLIHKDTQTDSQEFETCGFVQRSTKDGNFSLTCFHCFDRYELLNWENYLMHYSKVHSLQKGDAICENNDVAPTTHLFETIDVGNGDEFCAESISNWENGDLIEQNVVEKATEEFLIPQDGETFEAIDDIIEELDTVDVGVDYEKCKKDSLSNRENDDDDPAQSFGVVNFYDKNSSKALKFLKVLKAHPLLWHARYYGPKKFDNETVEFLNDLNGSIALVDFNKSLIRARKFQQRFSDLNEAKKLKLEMEPQLQKYFAILNEIALLSENFAFRCDHCPYYVLDEIDLSKHKFKKHQIGSKFHVCSCGKHFQDAKEKKAHESTHNTEPNFTCEHCGLLFFSLTKLDNHIILNHPDAVVNPKTYQCLRCDEVFPKHYMLKWHELKHEPPRYKCETCGKAYIRAFDYKEHIKKHLNLNDCICEQCGKGYATQRQLTIHRLKVHKLGEHYCEHCRIYFTSHENQHAHMQKFHLNGANVDRKKKMHKIIVKRYHDRLKAARPCSVTRKKPELKCKECGMIFERLAKFRQHKKKMQHYSCDRRYKCPHCQLVLSSYQTFIRHLRKIHDIPANYSDIKNFKPYTGSSDEKGIEDEVAAVTDAEMEYINECAIADAEHEDNYDLKNLSSKEIIAVEEENYEDVQYIEDEVEYVFQQI